jgi:2-phosphosulfolactate phosphatase
MLVPVSAAAVPADDWKPIVRICGIDDAPSASGTVVVIDVIRAFTTAAVAFANGAEHIWCVEGLDEAVVLGRATVGAVVMGEERGLRPDRFDLGNSPTEPARDVVGGRTVVQRTSNGTRALVAATGAEELFAMAASNVTATYRCLGLLRPYEVSLVCSGALSDDLACAEHLYELIRRGTADTTILTERIVASAGEHMERWKVDHVRAERDRFLADIAVCAAVDTVGFAMAATRHDRYVELRRVNV